MHLLLVCKVITILMSFENIINTNDYLYFINKISGHFFYNNVKIILLNYKKSNFLWNKFNFSVFLLYWKTNVLKRFLYEIKNNKLFKYFLSHIYTYIHVHIILFYSKTVIEKQRELRDNFGYSSFCAYEWF